MIQRIVWLQYRQIAHLVHVPVAASDHRVFLDETGTACRGMPWATSHAARSGSPTSCRQYRCTSVRPSATACRYFGGAAGAVPSLPLRVGQRARSGGGHAGRVPRANRASVAGFRAHSRPRGSGPPGSGFRCRSARRCATSQNFTSAVRRSVFRWRRHVTENGPKPALYGPRGARGHEKFHHLAAADALGAVSRKDSCILPIIGAWSHTFTLG